VKNKARTNTAEPLVPKAAKTSAKVPRALVNVLNGSFLTRERVLVNMPFILWCAGLMLAWIAYGYWTERTVRKLDAAGKEMKEMRSTYITVRSRLEQTEQQSHVARSIGAIGLQQSLTAPQRLEVDDDLLEDEPARPGAAQEG
jgi:Bacteriodetes cell division protein (FtsL-like)